MYAPIMRLRALAKAVAANSIPVRRLLPGVLLLVAPAAFAQTAGHYQGTNNEGYQVDVYVATDGGGLAVTTVDGAGTVYCKGQAAGVWSVEVGTTAPITDGAASIDVLAVNLYYASALTFSGQKVKGTVTFAVPEFFSTAEPPKTACAGATKKQKFTATYVGTESRAPGPRTAQAWPIGTIR
jgi:hypothetical protein